MRASIADASLPPSRRRVETGQHKERGMRILAGMSREPGADGEPGADMKIKCG